MIFFYYYNVKILWKSLIFQKNTINQFQYHIFLFRVFCIMSQHYTNFKVSDKSCSFPEQIVLI